MTPSHSSESLSRRHFLTLSTGAALALTGKASDSKGEHFLYGACRPLSDAPLMKEAGFDFIEGSVGGFLMPDKSDEAWARMREKILASPLPLRSCNCFFPGTFHLTGPHANFKSALSYALSACQRADEVNCPYLVLGSQDARSVPGDILDPERKKRPDVEKGMKQFEDFCTQLAQCIASCRVTVVIEPLSPNQTNIVNYVWQGMQIVRAVNSPRIEVLADAFHMTRGREEVSSIIFAGNHLKHCHIGAVSKKYFCAAPGLEGESKEFLPFFSALKKIHYTGGISCECGWGEKADYQKNLVRAVQVMHELEEEAM